jgi:hypothetical protein
LAELCNNLEEYSISSNEDVILEDNEEIINVSALIDKLGAEPLVFDNELLKFTGIEMNNLPSSYLEIIDSSNSIESDNINIDNSGDAESDITDSNDDDDCDIDDDVDVNIDTLPKSQLEVLKKLNLNSINIDLDYENSENDKSENDKLNETFINFSEEICINKLKSYKSYKLYELQQLADINNITTSKVKNGKIKNKTKKELYNEINNMNLQK